MLRQQSIDGIVLDSFRFRYRNQYCECQIRLPPERQRSCDWFFLCTRCASINHGNLLSDWNQRDEPVSAFVLYIAGLDWIGSDRQQASNASGIFTTRNVACHSELLFDRRRNISIYSCESIDRSNCWKRSFLLKMMFIGKQYCLMTDPLEGLYWLGV